MMDNWNNLLKEVKKQKEKSIWREDNNVIKTSSGVRRISENDKNSKQVEQLFNG